MTVARQSRITLPIGVCLSCFNEQQQLSFPFLVYCAHSETLAVINGPAEHTTYRCAPSQLEGVLRQLHAATSNKV